MDDRMEGSRLRPRAATLVALGGAALLLAVAMWPSIPRERATGLAPSLPSIVWSVKSRQHMADLTTLARCTACHLGDHLPDDSRLALASLPRSEPGARAMAADDDALVRIGADVYLIACAGCHADGRAASGTPRDARAVALHAAPQRDSATPARDRVAGEPARPAGSSNAPALTDEQIAALAAFLSRHTRSIEAARVGRSSATL